MLTQVSGLGAAASIRRPCQADLTSDLTSQSLFVRPLEGPHYYQVPQTSPEVMKPGGRGMFSVGKRRRPQHHSLTMKSRKGACSEISVIFGAFVPVQSQEGISEDIRPISAQYTSRLQSAPSPSVEDNERDKTHGCRV